MAKTTKYSGTQTEKNLEAALQANRRLVTNTHILHLLPKSRALSRLQTFS